VQETSAFNGANPRGWRSAARAPGLLTPLPESVADCPVGQDCRHLGLPLRWVSRMKFPARGWREGNSADGGRFGALFSPRPHTMLPFLGSRGTFLASRRRRGAAAHSFDIGRAVMIAVVLLGLAAAVRATSVIPISDRELYRRSDLVVYGVVVSSQTVEGGEWPETVTSIRPVRVLKGALAGDLVLRQAGGTLPDGRFFKLWGRPEYAVGHEVVVFAIARPDGDYQTAEMLLGKFEVGRDETGRLFAVPELSLGTHPGVEIRALPDFDEDALSREDLPSARFLRDPGGRAAVSEARRAPRELATFLNFLDAGAPSSVSEAPASPVGRLEPVVHETERSGLTPEWGNINNSLWRWNNGATAGWQLVGTANITGGGTTEAVAALATWTNDPNSTINYTQNQSASNQIQLSATSSPCGWSTCVTSSGGVVGCGGPSGGGSNSWLGDSYNTITGGTVWLRCYATLNAFGSSLTQSFLTHELGHTLGLGHSDQNVSPHDVCRGDESTAIMTSVSTGRTTLGTDDQDAVRWLYGDGGNHCTSPPAPSVTGVTPSFGPVAGGTLATITGANFQSGATVTFGGTAATNVTFVGSASLTAQTPAHAAGLVNVVVTNLDAQSGALANAYTFQNGSGFYTLSPCRVLDTRNATGPLGGPALTAGSDRTFTVVGHCGIPSGARAISVNATVTLPSLSGDVRFYAAGTSLPIPTAIVYGSGQTRANNAVIALSPGGAFTVHCDQAAGTVQFLVDVNGYYQ
jgi:IPT/TIG domain-containing protein